MTMGFHTFHCFSLLVKCEGIYILQLCYTVMHTSQYSCVDTYTFYCRSLKIVLCFQALYVLESQQYVSIFSCILFVNNFYRVRLNRFI